MQLKYLKIFEIFKSMLKSLLVEKASAVTSQQNNVTTAVFYVQYRCSFLSYQGKLKQYRSSIITIFKARINFQSFSDFYG